MPVDVASPHCGCGCRPADACAPGCPCSECQPGPGLDHAARRHNAVGTRRARMRDLLKEQDHRTLTSGEIAELDDLIVLYLHKEA